MKGSRIQGVKGSSDMLKNYKLLNVWQKSYRAGSMKGARGCRENAKSYDQVPGKQTLESLNPGLLGSFLPTNWEKNQKKSPRMVSVRPRGFPSYHLKGFILFNKSNSFAFPTIRPPGSAIQVTQ